MISHLLSQVAYEDVPKQEVELPARVRPRRLCAHAVKPELYVPEVF
jgi:hypothetical protein